MGYPDDSIRDWQNTIAAWGKSKGWTPVLKRAGKWRHDAISAQLALVHSEVSEALECVRTDHIETSVRYGDKKPEGFASELADVVIRCLHLASLMGIDLQREIEAKHAYNVTRPRRHGGKRL